VLAGLGGALLTIVGFLLYYLGGGLANDYPPLTWQGEQITVALGQGRLVAGVLEIEPVNGAVLIKFANQTFMARPYGKLVWNIEGLSPGHDIRLIWSVQSDVNGPKQTSLLSVRQQHAQWNLRDEKEWEGYVVSWGIYIRGLFTQALHIHQVQLVPEALDTSALLQQFWLEWTTSEYWSQRSAHYVSGAPRKALFHPIIITVVWIVLSNILYGVWLVSQRRPLRLTSFGVFFLIGWGLVDLRWQMDLTQRSIVTYYRFANEDYIGKKIVADDGDLFEFLQKIHRHLPDHPVRIFIVNDDFANRAALRNYMVARARYHLQPHNSFADPADGAQLQEAKKVDYVLILWPQGYRFAQSKFRYDPKKRLLLWGASHWPAEIIYTEKMGALFRMMTP